MSRPYVYLEKQPPAFEAENMPGDRVLLKFYADPVKVEIADGGENWRASYYTLLLPNAPGLAQRIEANLEPWKEKAREYTEAREAAMVRSERDRRLAVCDYTATLDYPASDAEREAWRAYRQALRDISEQPDFPWTVTWPEAPAREKATDTVLAAFDELLGGDGE